VGCLPSPPSVLLRYPLDLDTLLVLISLIYAKSKCGQYSWPIEPEIRTGMPEWHPIIFYFMCLHSTTRSEFVEADPPGLQMPNWHKMALDRHRTSKKKRCVYIYTHAYIYIYNKRRFV
jgi:hypothetical protein